jgi:hypothetical protein
MVMTQAVITQVQAAVKHKTLLLLWWIEVEEGDGCGVQVPGKVASGVQPHTNNVWCVCGRVELVRGSNQESNPLLGCLGPPFIAQGVTTVAKQSLSYE